MGSRKVLKNPFATFWRVRTEFIIIGGGTAGLNTMKTAHALGANIAIVEEENFAGTCLRPG